MKKSRISKHGKSNIAKLKRKLDILFSQFIRARDKDQNCISCKFRGNLQAGHFRRRELMASRWDEKNVNGQCARCNLWLGGAAYEYAQGLERKYGAGTADKLYKLSQTTKQWSAPELEAKIEEYKEKVNRLKIEIEEGI